MDYESSDILGSNSFPVRNPGPAKWSGLSKTAFFLVLLLAAYVASVRGWAALLKWREKSYRLSMRRRHGIPDNDHRPFNVAYAAVLRARREEEVANNRVHRVDVDQLYDEAAATLESNARQRKNQYRAEPAWTNGPVQGLPGRFNPLIADSMFASSSTGLPSSSSHNPIFADRYRPNLPSHVVRFADEVEDAGVPRRSSLNNLNSPQKHHQKRAHEGDDVDSDVPENPKKTRVEGDEFIDGDEDAEWLPKQKRGEKRVLREMDLEEEEARGRKAQGKRARKVSLETPDVLMTSDDNADDMDVDDEEHRPAVRGKKRNAGSTFGGEDDDTAVGDDAQKSKRRKRRSVGKRKSDAAAEPSRGQKRDRDAEEDGSDVEPAVPGTPTRSSRKTKKRGKKSKEMMEEDEEGSMDEGSAAKGKGRPIGDQWESNGVLYKIGPNGQRLRQALIKKAARKFIMPMDSQHPDRNANLEVCIETWLTEEEYRDFKTRHLLAWQDSPKGTEEPESMPATPVAEPPSTPTPNPHPVAKGKNLLWDSPASPFPVFAPSPAEKEQFRPKAHFRQSIAADLGGIRSNPFEKVTAFHVAGAELAKNGVRVNGRRVVAARDSGLADSTNNVAGGPIHLPRRTFSKWEKQDLEAKAMMKMREANQAKVKEKELKEKLEKEKKDREAAAAAPIPTISFNKPPEGPAVKPPTLSFAPPASATGSSTSSGPQPPSFSIAPTSTAAPPKLSFGPPATTDKPPQPPSGNPFAPPTASATAAPSAGNLFAPTRPGAAPISAPGSNLFAPPQSTAPAAPPASNQPGAPSFSFPSAAPAGNKNNGFAPPADRPVAGAPQRNTSQFSFPPSNTAAPSNSGAPPSFSFAPPQNAAPTGGGGGGSLLSRMGGGGGGATAPKPAEAAASSPAPPMFSFKAPEQPPASKPATGTAPSPFAFKAAEPAASKPASAFAAPPSAASQSSAATPPEAPKFSFAAKPTTAPAANSSSLSGALGASDPKPSSPFSFAQPKPAETPASTTTTPSGAPVFSFGMTAPAPAGGSEQKKEQPKGFSFAGAGSAFGGGATGSGATAAAPSPFGGSGAGAAPSAFGGGAATSAFGGGSGSGAATPSAFGGGSGAATPSVFGNGGASSAFGGKSAFGGGGSAFGSSATKPAEEAPKPASVFGSSTPAANNAAPASAAPVFSFGGNNASTTPASSPAPANPFATKPSAFGATSTFGSKPAGDAASTTPQGSPFGAFGATNTKPATGSAFGGGFGGSAFGTKPEGTTTTPFGTPGTPSVFGNAAASGPSAFGFGGSTTTPK